MEIQITRRKDQPVAAWAGGATTELCISPATASCAERNFAFRVSSATVELAESVFSDFSGFTRHIMPLEGSMELWHNGTFAAKLAPHQTHTFDGGWQTRSLGTCVDFNLIHSTELRGALQVVRNTAEAIAAVPVAANSHTGLYALCNGLVVSGEGFSTPVEPVTLNIGDFLLLRCQKGETPGEIRLVAEAELLAVVATIC